MLSSRKAQNRTQVAAKHDGEFAVLRHEGDLIDQGTKHVDSGTTIFLQSQVFAELTDPILIHLRYVRVQQRRRLVGIVQKFGQLRLPRLQLLGLVFELCGRESLKNGFDHLVEFTVNLLELTLPAGQVGPALDPEPVYLARELGTEFIEEFRRHEMPPKAIQDRRLQGIPTDVQTVIACALVPRRCAAKQVFRDQGVPTTTATALDKAGETVLRSPSIVHRIAACRRRIKRKAHLPLLYCVPEILVHNPKVRDLLDNPLTFRVRAGDALAGVRILQVSQTVPEQPTDVEFIVENPCPSFRVSVDCRRHPLLALRSRNALPVQGHCDRPRGLSGQVIPENAPNDVCFGWVDLPLAPIVRIGRSNDVIPIAETTTGPSHLDPTAKTAPRLVSEILQEERAHRPLETDVLFADLTFGQRYNADACEPHPLVQPGDVLLVPRETIQRLREDHLEAPL